MPESKPAAHRRSTAACGTDDLGGYVVIVRSLAIAEPQSWRQDWSDRSIHPASVDGASTVTQKVA
jgi:hypothetical protein